MKNKFLINTISLSLLLGSIAIPQSCNDDAFDLKPEGRPTTGEVPVGGYEAMVFGLYSALRTQGGVSDFSYIWTHGIRSDDNEKGSTASDASADGSVFDRFGYVATNTHITTNWDGHYKIIFDANELINTAEASNDRSEGTRVNIAEAKFLRAYCYFQLRRDFGEVPIILKTIEDPQDEIAAKSTLAQVDAQIEKDLKDAAESLPMQWTSAHLGRVTKGTANSYLAKLYLYQKQWAKSLAMLQDVIGSGVYQLNTNYDVEFSKAGNNSRESIFEVQKTYDYATKYSNNFYESQGVRGSGIWDLGWGFNVPSDGLVAAYENGDKRKQTTILESGKPDIYNSRDESGALLILPDSPPLAQKYWNGKAYTLPSERKQYAENKNHWENIKLMRYADVILMAAEAANELGQTEIAKGYINQIRNRAGLANTTAISQTDVRNAIKHERRVEFGMEYERFYDLVRWGDALSVLSNKGYSARNEYFPIPQSAIDRSQGVLQQNPNY